MLEVILLGLAFEGAKKVVKKVHSGFENLPSSSNGNCDDFLFQKVVTYNHRHEWDQKVAKLKADIESYEAERDALLPDCARLKATETRKKTLQAQLKQVQSLVDANFQQQQKLQQQMEELRNQKSCDAVVTAWRKKAREEVDNLLQTFPSLVQKTEEMAEAHIGIVENQGTEAENLLDSYHEKLLQERKSQIDENKSLIQKQKQLVNIVKKLDKILTVH